MPGRVYGWVGLPVVAVLARTMQRIRRMNELVHVHPVFAIAAAVGEGQLDMDDVIEKLSSEPSR